MLTTHSPPQKKPYSTFLELWGPWQMFQNSHVHREIDQQLYFKPQSRNQEIKLKISAKSSMTPYPAIPVHRALFLSPARGGQWPLQHFTEGKWPAPLQKKIRELGIAPKCPLENTHHLSRNPRRIDLIDVEASLHHSCSNAGQLSLTMAYYSSSGSGYSLCRIHALAFSREGDKYNSLSKYLLLLLLTGDYNLFHKFMLLETQ